MILSFLYRNYMNDSFRTNVFVRFLPETIACACIYLAARQLQVKIMSEYIYLVILYLGTMGNTNKHKEIYIYINSTTCTSSIKSCTCI